jgi:hypothetical protein
VEIKIVEEWGYAVGEDTCLFEEENRSEASPTDDDVEYDEPEGRRDVDLLIEKLAEEVRDEDGVDFQGKGDVEDGRVSEMKDEWNEEVQCPVFNRVRSNHL